MLHCVSSLFTLRVSVEWVGVETEHAGKKRLSSAHPSFFHLSYSEFLLCFFYSERGFDTRSAVERTAFPLNYDRPHGSKVNLKV